MNKAKVAAIGTGALALVAVAFVLVTLLVKVLWAWTIPDLFPGAVDKGLVAESLSWGTAMKVAIFAAVLTGLGQGHHRSTVVSSGGQKP
jgi:uncharacterized membrane protein